MIWGSVALMTLIDVVILSAVGWVGVNLLRRRSDLERARVFTAALATLAGLGLLAVFHLIDLYTMWVLPAYAGAERAMGVMENLHLNWGWVASVSSVAAISGGLAMPSRKVLRLVEESDHVSD